MSHDLVQYVRRGSGYLPIGETVAALDPGYYDVVNESGTLVFARKAMNTDALLRLPDTKSDQVVSEIERFWALKGTFSKFGLVHKRGFLLYGPPGSGKSSTIAIVIAAAVKAGGLAVNGASMAATHLKKMLHDLREVEPSRPLVVSLEDVDVLLKSDESTLLSLLDGDANIDNVVFIATTNYPERLDARIINRPSRFDQVVRIGMPTREARRQYILHCDPSCPLTELEAWLDLTDDFSIAQVKEVVVGVRCLGHSVEETVHRLRSGGIDVANEKKIAKQKRDRTFFEKFHDACVDVLPKEQMDGLRNKAVGVAKAVGGVNGKQAVV